MTAIGPGHSVTIDSPEVVLAQGSTVAVQIATNQGANVVLQNS